MAYPWMTHAWHAQAEAAERSARPFLSQRRWTDKDVVVSMASPPLMFGWGGTTGWPEIPKGVGADFEGERALRVFLEITDGPEKRPLAPEAVLYAKLSGADAVRAGLTKDDEFLVVPLKIFTWVTGALSFEKKVLLSLQMPIREHSLTHKDAAEIGPELVWIVPMKSDERKYFYAVLPLVLMGSSINSRKGNPGIFRDLQPDPYRHLVWDIVDEVVGRGINAWGTDGGTAPGRTGQQELEDIKLRLVNFLRDLADAFVVEDFQRMIEDGGFDRGEVHKAVSNGFGQHKPDCGKALRGHWLERADVQWWERFMDLCDRFLGLGSYTGAIQAYMNGLGRGWSPDPTVQLGEAAGLIYDLVDPTATLDAIARLVAMTREGTDRDGEAFKLFMSKLQQAAVQLRHSNVLRREGIDGAVQDFAEGTPEEKEAEYQRIRREWMPPTYYEGILAGADRRFRNE